MTRSKRQSGFTIIELTLATAIFSIILLVVTAGIVNFSRTYIKGVRQSQTQEAGRLILSEVSQAVQFSSDFVADDNGTPGLHAYCLGTVKYSFYRGGNNVGGGTHALVKSPFTGGNCVASGYTAGSSTELIGEGMRLKEFSIAQAGDVYTITIEILNGEPDLFDSNDKCKTGAGSAFCATVFSRAFVQRRL